MSGVKLPDRGDQTKHTFLNQIFALPSRKEKRPGTRAYKLHISFYKDFFSFPVSRSGHLLELEIRKCGKINHIFCLFYYNYTNRIIAQAFFLSIIFSNISKN